MIIACPACATRYVVPDNAIGIEGRTVRCAKCRNSWFQDGSADASLVGQGEGQGPDQPSVGSPSSSASATGSDGSRPGFDDTHLDNRQGEAAEETSQEPVAQTAARYSGGISASSDDTANSSHSDDNSRWGGDPQDKDVSQDRDPIPDRDEADLGPPPEPDPIIKPDPDTDDRPADSGDEYSHFESEPPFRPRTNPLKIWTGAALIFAALAISTVVAVSYYGLPEWVPVSRPTFGPNQPDLVLDFPKDQQETRTLPDGTEFFGTSGTITNVGTQSHDVPNLLIQLVDEDREPVHSWVVVPPKSRIAPGETITINEAAIDIPEAADEAWIGWKP